MDKSKVRVVVTAVLFIAWLGYLAYLVVQSRDAVILSRPQFLVAHLYVIADLEGDAHPNPALTIREVAWAADQQDAALAGTAVKVHALDKCGPEHGWSGPGRYILALSRTKDGPGVTPIPSSPGYGGGPRRIYPDTPDARRQLRELVAAWKR